MKKTLLRFLAATTLLALAFSRAGAQEPGVSDSAAAAPHAVGFRLVEFRDASRTYFGHATPAGVIAPEFRPMRMYLWYPSRPGAAAPLPFEAFARMASDDFEGQPVNGPRNLSLPVPLARAFSPVGLEAVLGKPTLSFRDATPLPGRHPLVLIATGLFYESPLTFLSLSEYLAGRGYIVAACPLRGTYGRLVRLTVPDLETLVRDLEAVLAKAQEVASVDSQRIGLIGYDMGGMAAIVMAMRNPLIRAFASYDSSIITPHYSGLPVSHPGYDLRRLVVPWIHFNQSRFQTTIMGKSNPPTVIEKKEFGDNYLVLVRTTNHGAFTTYAGLGIENPVPGFWREVEPNLKAISRAVSESTLLFFDAYLQKDAVARSRLQALAVDNRYPEAFGSFEFAAGREVPLSQDEWIGCIIRDGMAATLPGLEEFRTLYPAERHFDEAALNWLGYHFLSWWGREGDAVALFEWTTRVFPQSWNAFDSLGEAFLATGQRDKAMESYRRSLELNPANENAKAMLERLAQK
jgi:tetratricopeptide (TPR) repeat protein